MYVIAGTSKPSSLGQAGSVVGSVVIAIAGVLTTSIQLIYQEIQANKARKQWRHDQLRLNEQARLKADELQKKNDELLQYISSITSPGNGAGTASAALADYSPYIPYVIVGGAVAAAVLLTRRKSA